jgi:hypothetical protein
VLQAICRQRLPPILCPRHFYDVPQFPTIASGKIDRELLTPDGPSLPQHLCLCRLRVGDGHQVPSFVSVSVSGACLNDLSVMCSFLPPLLPPLAGTFRGGPRYDGDTHNDTFERTKPQGSCRYQAHRLHIPTLPTAKKAQKEADTKTKSDLERGRAWRRRWGRFGGRRLVFPFTSRSTATITFWRVVETRSRR